jgi:hypothetical protein
MDKFSITILPDGTIKSTSDEVSPENHQNAEAFLAMLAGLTGGSTARQARGDIATHHAVHHQHGEHGHSH